MTQYKNKSGEVRIFDLHFICYWAMLDLVILCLFRLPTTLLTHILDHQSMTMKTVANLQDFPREFIFPCLFAHIPLSQVSLLLLPGLASLFHCIICIEGRLLLFHILSVSQFLLFLTTLVFLMPLISEKSAIE